MSRGQRVSVTINRTATASGAKTYEVEPIRSGSTLRYRRWLADTVDKVTRASGGDLGYMHITAMGTDSIGRFDKFLWACRHRKGLVIDVRGNRDIKSLTSIHQAFNITLVRTTLTLDDDVAAALRAAMKKHRRPLKAVVNEALRVGLDTIDRRRAPRKVFQTRGFNLGPSLVGSLDNVEEVLSRAEGEDHR